MSRHDRFGVVYSGDLYLRSWELERESSHRNLGLSDSSADQQDDQQMHQHQHDFRYPCENTLCVSILHTLLNDEALLSLIVCCKHLQSYKNRKIVIQNDSD
jgi:hypothetical protein